MILVPGTKLLVHDHSSSMHIICSRDITPDINDMQELFHLQLRKRTPAFSPKIHGTNDNPCLSSGTRKTDWEISLGAVRSMSPACVARCITSRGKGPQRGKRQLLRRTHRLVATGNLVERGATERCCPVGASKLLSLSLLLTE
jgi:hypothetical protein